MSATPLTETELQQALASLPDWKVIEGQLDKTFAFGAYLDGIEFVRRLGQAAEEANHHPDLQVGWRKVRVQLCTHSAKAITELDLALARRAETLAGPV